MAKLMVTATLMVAGFQFSVFSRSEESRVESQESRAGKGGAEIRGEANDFPLTTDN